MLLDKGDRQVDDPLWHWLLSSAAVFSTSSRLDALGARSAVGCPGLMRASRCDAAARSGAGDRAYLTGVAAIDGQRSCHGIAASRRSGGLDDDGAGAGRRDELNADRAAVGARAAPEC